MPRQPIGANRPDENSMDVVNQGLTDVLEKHHSSLSLVKLYSSVDVLVNSGKYAQLSTVLSNLLDKTFQTWLSDLQNQIDDPLVNAFSGYYTDFQSFSRIIPKFFGQFDMFMKRQLQKADDIPESLSIIRSVFEKRILSVHKLMDDTISRILALIHSSRMNSDTSKAVIGKIVQMFYDFKKTRNDHFNTFFMRLQDDTAIFYQKFFENNFSSEFTAYLIKCRDAIAFEDKLLGSFLEPENIVEIQTLIFSTIAFNRSTEFYSGEPPPVSQALIAEDIRPLKWLADTHRRFDVNPVTLFETCAKYIKDRILQIANGLYPADAGEERPDAENIPITTVVSVLQDIMKLILRLRDHYKNAFKNFNESVRIIQTAIEEGWNDHGLTIEILFARYIDFYIKNEFKSYTAEDGLLPIEQLCFEFALITKGKDEFAQRYEQLFIPRLVSMRNKIPEIEQPIIESIRRAKMQHFLKDYKAYIARLQYSSDHTTNFKSEVASQGEKKLKIDINPIIFECTKWPLGHHAISTYPSFLRPLIGDFNTFFTGKHPDYLLELQSDLSTVECKWRCPPNKSCNEPRQYTIIGSMTAASILFFVSQSKSRSVQQLFDDIQIDTYEIKETLVTLCKKTLPLLKRTSANQSGSSDEKKHLAPEDVIEMNTQFYARSVRIVIPPVKTQRKKAKKEEDEHVMAQKEAIYKSHLVRILKTRNSLSQEELEQACIQSTSQMFRQDLATMRRMIDKLAEDEYLRHNDKTGLIEYIT